MTSERINTETMAYLKTLTLLCVEDDKTHTLLYSSIFKDVVKDIVHAADGNEGYAKYKNGDIDIIISDYAMPICNGLEMVEKIRIEDKDIPIVLVSAIEKVEIIIKSLELGVNKFVQKPIKVVDIFNSIEDMAKILIANKFLNERKEKENYQTYQEKLGLAKELNILRNDFYYQTVDVNPITMVDFLYQPLDILSGDAYCARRIDKHITFYLMLDGMGKGLSASLSAMIMTSFVNHIIDKMLEINDFDLSLLIHESMSYIKPILLEEEALAIDYIVLDNEDKMLYYSKFAMPVLLMENSSSELIRIKSNNPPLSKWNDTFNIGSYDISEVHKFLIYSDGIVENETIFDNKPYSEFIEEDFLNSFTREDLKNSFMQKIKDQEDDVTLIYIHNLKSTSIKVENKVFETSLKALDDAGQWYENLWKSITDDSAISYLAEVVFTELMMNAYEHGNLGIDSSLKHKLIDEDKYFDTLQEKEKDCNKTITIKVDKIKHKLHDYIITQILDEGLGFDTQILSEIFRNSATFNGRGVFVSRKNSLGIYYNCTGNNVLFLHKV